VTLSGQLIDISGTMSGGGSKPARGGMAAKLVEEISPAELKALERDVEENATTLAELRTRRSELEKQVSERRSQSRTESLSRIFICCFE
jgi:structural maintenance of chromosome 4